MSDGAAAPTERLYYTDAYLAEFNARVVDRSEDGRRIYLDRTAFYPTSGGQLHDLGSLGGVPIADVVDEDGRIAHVLAAPIGAADSVSGAIDWSRRFDHMQQHTGQHLLSAVFEDLFGARTISVHFGDGHSTLDLEIDALSAEKVETAEHRANALIAENRAVTVRFEDAATAEGLRKAVDRQGSLRVVGIDRLDRSACGGTHVRATGEIGCAMLRGTERIRKTMRVEFLCGLRAVHRARADYLALASVASSLSAAMDDVPSLVGSQATQLKESEQARRRLERELAGFHARTMHENASPLASGVRVVAGGDRATMDQLRTIGQALLELPRCVYVGTTEKGDQLLVTATEDSGFDAGKLIRDALTSVGGKGGGSPRLAQGSAPTPALVADAVALIRDALARGQ